MHTYLRKTDAARTRTHVYKYTDAHTHTRTHTHTHVEHTMHTLAHTYR